MDRSNMSLTTREFAKKAGVSAATVSKWLRQGTIDGKKSGGKWSISAAELSKVKATQPPGNPPPPSESQTHVPSPEIGTQNRSYSIQEFSKMTYLTQFGVQKWLEQGRLKKIVDAQGQERVAGSNLDNPDVKRLLR
jgi:excisionase family DNA binding protein